MNALTPPPGSLPQLPRRRVRRADQEFLPAALEILETPPSPVGIWLLWIICTLAAVALAWSYFGRIDIIAVAQGKIRPTGQVKVIQPLETGRVAKVEVENGQHVAKGQVLVTFDSSESDADAGQVENDLQALNAEVTRRRTAVQAVEYRKIEPIPPITWEGELPDTIKRRENEVLIGDLHKLESNVDAIAAQRLQKQREADRYTANASALSDLVSTLQSGVNVRSTLNDFGSGSKIDLINATETLQEQKVALAIANGQIAEATMAVEVLSRQIEDAYRSFLADNLQKIADAERQIDEARQKLVKARVYQDRMVLASPIDGIVSNLSITTIGQVVGAGDEVMRIVPSLDGEKGAGIEIEAYVQNRDIGFVKQGQTAIVKVESLPFTRYGTINAVLTRLASDAIPETAANQREADPSKASSDRGFSSAEPVQSLVFPATFGLSAATMQADGATVPLSPGMAVTVEIKTGSRRIIDYLLSPLSEVANEAIRER